MEIKWPHRLIFPADCQGIEINRDAAANLTWITASLHGCRSHSNRLVFAHHRTSDTLERIQKLQSPGALAETSFASFPSFQCG